MDCGRRLRDESIDGDRHRCESTQRVSTVRLEQDGSTEMISIGAFLAAEILAMVLTWADPVLSET